MLLGGNTIGEKCSGGAGGGDSGGGGVREEGRSSATIAVAGQCDKYREMQVNAESFRAKCLSLCVSRNRFFSSPSLSHSICE